MNETHSEVYKKKIYIGSKDMHDCFTHTITSNKNTTKNQHSPHLFNTQ